MSTDNTTTSTATTTVGAASAPTARPRRRHHSLLTRTDKIILTIMVAVPTLIQLVLIWIPMVLSILLSFTTWNGLDLSDIHFAGFDNYAFIFKDYPPFWPAASHNVLWLLFLAVISAPLGILLAVLLDQNIRGSRIYQSVFFVPVMLSLALIGIIWQLFYSKDNGLLNFLLGTSGTPAAVDWFGNSDVNIWAAMVAATWRNTGYVMILYLAGLKGIDPALREAASLDGANGRQTFFQIVLPAMRPINIVIIVITVIESLRAFDIVYVINRGTNGLELMSALVIQNLVGEGQVIGVGSALAVVLLVISLIPITFYLSRAFGKDKS